jgi:hypothetical protein
MGAHRIGELWGGKRARGCINVALKDSILEVVARFAILHRRRGSNGELRCIELLPPALRCCCGGRALVEIGGETPPSRESLHDRYFRSAACGPPPRGAAPVVDGGCGACARATGACRCGAGARTTAGACGAGARAAGACGRAWRAIGGGACCRAAAGGAARPRGVACGVTRSSFAAGPRRCTALRLRSRGAGGDAPVVRGR